MKRKKEQVRANVWYAPLNREEGTRGTEVTFEQRFEGGEGISLTNV